MTNHRRIEIPCSFLVRSVFVAGVGFSLGACSLGPASTASDAGEAGPTSSTGGSFGPTGGASGSAGAAGQPGRASGSGGAVPTSTCVNGQPVSAQPKVGRVGVGFQPVIPDAVTTATTPVPPLSGGTLVVLADASTAVVSDPERDVVYLVDLTTKGVRPVALQAGDEPGRIVGDDAGRVHVALRSGGAIVTIDPKTATVSARRAVCSAPRGFAYQATTQTLHVACAGGELVSMPAAGGAATRQVTLERDLRDVVVQPNGTLLVSTFRKADVLVVGADGTITSRLTPGSGPVPTIIGMPQMRTPSVAWRMVARGDATEGVVMLHQTGVTDTIDPSAGGYAGLKGCGGIVESGVSVLTPGAASPGVASGINGVALAVDVALSADQKKIAIAVPGNAKTQGGPTIVEGDTATLAQSSPSANMNTCGVQGQSPQNSPPTGQVVAVAYAPTGVLFAQTREPAGLWRGDTGETISLATDSRDDTGHDIFHVNAGGGLACASCHPEGGEDGRVWNFACAGARRTQSIRGGISATAPFHWDGSEHDFSRLMDDVFSGRMAGPMLTSVQKSSLQTWVDTIPALPASAGSDSSAVSRGKALFNDPAVACATCHAGTLLTNNTTVDVGTGQALQVPSLRGVAWRAPYMHNGCAATLTDRFGAATCSGGDKHGVTSTLTTSQTADLTAYLESL